MVERPNHLMVARKQREREIERDRERERERERERAEEARVVQGHAPSDLTSFR
jgi:hypothetical protein